MARNFSPSAANCGQQRPDIVINGLANISISSVSASVLCFLIAIEREVSVMIAMTLMDIIVIFLHYSPHCRPCHHHGHNQFPLPAPAQCTSAARTQATPHRAETFYSLELHNTDTAAPSCRHKQRGLDHWSHPASCQLQHCH